MKRAIATLFALALSAGANAELMFDPLGQAETGRGELGGFFGTSRIEYEAGNKFDLDRTYIGEYGAYGVSNNVDVIGLLALITESEVEDADAGDGYHLGAGVRTRFPLNADLDLVGYGQFRLINEDGEFGNQAFELDGHELLAGAGVAMALNPTIEAFAAGELVLLEDVDIETTSIDHDGKFGGRLGLRADLGDGYALSGQLAILNESSLQIGILRRF